MVEVMISPTAILPWPAIQIASPVTATKNKLSMAAFKKSNHPIAVWCIISTVWKVPAEAVYGSRPIDVVNPIYDANNNLISATLNDVYVRTEHYLRQSDTEFYQFGGTWLLSVLYQGTAGVELKW